MKKPLQKDYCKPFALDSKFVCFDSKAYSRAASAYINHLEGVLREIANDYPFLKQSGNKSGLKLAVKAKKAIS